ncbi:MAG: BatD family protein, partial [Gemmatimonadota bacterium]
MRLLLLVVAMHAQDPVRVQARLLEPEIDAGETVVLRVEVETEGEGARIAPLRTLPPGIELQGSRSFDQRQFSMPGGTRRFISREFVLRARAPGRYRIPSVRVVVQGQTYETESALLTVGARAPGPGGSTGPPEAGVALRAWLTADTVYAGEQVTFNAEALFSQDARLRLRRAPEYEPPSPSGFWIQDLPDRRSPVSRSVDGQIYEVQRFRRALFPLTPGVYEIPPARLEYEIRRGLLYAPETRQALSDTLRLVVLPVPEPRPAGFTGAVGRFSIRAALEPPTVPAGEAAVLNVEIEGEGNLKALPPPELPPLEGVEVFPPSEEAETDVENGAVRGQKRFSWVLIPRRA